MDIEKSVQFALAVSADDLHGYSQLRRTISSDIEKLRDVDCSALVISALRAGGLNTGKASYTGDMLKSLIDGGMTDVTASVNLRTGEGLSRGDVLLRPKTSRRGGHTAIYIGEGKIVHAVSDYDRKTGDSSGKEVRKQPYYDSPFTNALRYINVIPDAPKGAIGTIVNCRLWCNRRQKPTEASPSVGRAQPGDAVAINGKHLTNGSLWFHDSIGNWIHSRFVEIDSNLVPWM